MKTAIEALRLLATGATIGTALAAVLFLALAALGLHTPLSALGMLVVIVIGGVLMAVLSGLGAVLTLVARTEETPRAGQVREVQR